MSDDVIDTSGFYKLDGTPTDGVLLFGPHYVLNAHYALYRELHDTYELPVDGWYWFDDEATARTFFGLPPAGDDGA
jgi:hypothetical protein